MQFLFEPWNEKRTKDIIDYISTLSSKKLVIIQDPKRSLLQNNTYWDNIEILAKHSWYTKEEMSTIIKHSITESGKLKMVEYVTTKKGKTYPIQSSTADLNTKDFWILMDYVFQLWWVLWLQMNIPGDIVDIAHEIFA